MHNLPTRFQNTDGHPGRHVFIGLGIAAVGMLALLDNLRLFDVALLRTFWPLALVLLGLARLMAPGRHRLAGIALVLVGALLTAGNLGSDLFALRHWWPLFLIVGGLSMLRRDAGTTTPLPGDGVDTHASFSNLMQRSDSARFSGGRIDLSFANLDLDLGAARMDGQQAVLQIDTRFSGVTLRVPRDWQVVVEMSATAASINDRTQAPVLPAPRLILRGDALLGGVEIRH